MKKPNKKELIFLMTGALIVGIVWLAMTFINHSHLPLKPESANITTHWIPNTVNQWGNLINANAAKYKIDPNLIAIIMTLESGGNPKAQSSAGAIGLMQITGPTAGDIASKYLKQPTSNYDLSNPATNIEFGAAYLAQLRKTFGDWKQGPTWNETVELVAAGYNGGPGAANSLLTGKGLTDTQTVVYSRDAFNMWRERKSIKSPTYSRWLERGGQKLIDAALKSQ